MGLKPSGIRVGGRVPRMGQGTEAAQNRQASGLCLSNQPCLGR
jgi:hypothetical protein